MQRFDEVELQAAPLVEPMPLAAGAPERAAAAGHAPRMKRLLALIIDLSLFLALTLALSPLLPAKRDLLTTGGLAGFVLVTSYYYFVGTWLLWGKTVGGAIFDVRVVAGEGGAMSLQSASLRWGGMLLSLATGGIGFLLAALPSRLSLPDRLSETRCIAAA